MKIATPTTQAAINQPKSRIGSTARLSSPGTYTPRSSNQSAQRANQRSGLRDDMLHLREPVPSSQYGFGRACRKARAAAHLGQPGAAGPIGEAERHES